MKEIFQMKNRVAKMNGYPSWQEFEDFVINHNDKSVVVAQLLVPAMEQVCKRLILENPKFLAWKKEHYYEDAGGFYKYGSMAKSCTQDITIDMIYNEWLNSKYEGI